MSSKTQSSGAPQGPAGSRLPPRLAKLAAQVSAWLNASRSRAIAAAAALLLLGLAGAVTLLTQARRALSTVEAPQERVTLLMALEALDRGYYSQARELALKLRQQPLPPGQRGGPAFVFGAVAAHDAAELVEDDQRNRFAVAARYLEESRSAGFPAGYESQGLFLLGKSLCLSGQPAEGRGILEQALGDSGQPTPDAQRLLANAYSVEPGRDLAKALSYIEEYLKTPDLPATERQNSLMFQAQLLWEAGDFVACRAALDQIPPETVVAPDAALLRGRLVLESARQLKAAWKADPTEDRRLQVMAKYEEAMRDFRSAQDDPLRPATVRQGLYLLGLSYLEIDDYRSALSQFARARKVYLDTPEGIAAALQEADLLRELDQPDEAVAAYCRALGAIPEEHAFVNPWIPADDYRSRVLEAYRHWLDAADYDRAIAVAQRLAPLFTKARQAQVLAETYRAWAAKLLADAANMREPEATEAVHRGRALWRKAGTLYEEMAQHNFTSRDYADALWQTANAYLEGHDFRRAAAMFEAYLKHELRRRRPRALTGLAEARLGLNDLDGTLAATADCIEYYPQDAASYDARYLAAEAHLERGELSEAESLLRQNLTNDLLTPESREWRDSLFLLGKVLHTDRRYEEAIQRLQEAVARYPNTPQSIEAQYLIAEAYREAAKVPQEKLETDSIETARIAHQKQKNQYLAGAIENYQQVQGVLNQRQEQRELTPLEKAILRNSYFALGSAQFDLGRYEDALQTYSAASNRYQHDPEVLEAFVQMASCYRRLNHPLEARGTLQQAKVVLDRLPKDAPFTVATNFTRREWTELLDWLSNL